MTPLDLAQGLAAIDGQWALTGFEQSEIQDRREQRDPEQTRVAALSEAITITLAPHGRTWTTGKFSPQGAKDTASRYLLRDLLKITG